ncbi:MAG: porin [Burkholderiaceae bacterium]|nr:porin [Burkholderiaceae bacterium]
MKKSQFARTLIAMAAASFAIGAHAQSAVTIYGSLDDGVAHVSNVGGASLSSVNQGTMQPDVWGLRGSEDLGGGMKAGFKLESGFFSNTGTSTSSTRLFNRESSLTLSGDFGAVKLGNMPDFVFDFVGPLSNGYLLTNWYLFNPGNFDNLANTFEYQNAVRYTTPDLSGFTAGAMYSFGGVAGNTTANRDVGAGAKYVAGPLTVAFAYSNENNRAAGFGGAYLSTLKLGNGGTVFNNLITYALGASYTLGDVKLNAAYTQNKIELPTAVTVTQNNTQVGASWHYTPANALNLGFTHSTFDGADYNQFTVGNVYSFSKRTQVYVQTAYQKAGGSATEAFQNGAGASSTDNQWEASVGLHHSF